jgi:hypothetical protein
MTNITGRDNWIIAKALAYALEALDRLPDEWRPGSDMLDMEKLLAHHAGAHAATWRTEARGMLSRRGVTVENGELVVPSPEGAVVPFPG